MRFAGIIQSIIRMYWGAVLQGKKRMNGPRNGRDQKGIINGALEDSLVGGGNINVICLWLMHTTREIIKKLFLLVSGVPPPPRAEDWFDGNVPAGFSATETPQVGDVISNGSHMGIVSEPGKTSISASDIEGKVVENDWGFREGDEVKAWHYTE